MSLSQKLCSATVSRRLSEDAGRRKPSSGVLPWLLFATLLAVPRLALAAPTDDVYLLGPDSQPHDGVPQGKVLGPFTLASQI